MVIGSTVMGSLEKSVIGSDHALPLVSRSSLHRSKRLKRFRVVEKVTLPV
jgi:hypothetical protein